MIQSWGFLFLLDNFQDMRHVNLRFQSENEAMKLFCYLTQYFNHFFLKYDCHHALQCQNDKSNLPVRSSTHDVLS